MSGDRGRTTELATFGGGCFWCLEAAYEQLQGVERVVSGYSGGHVPSPNYAQVCSGTTGHAEVVQLHYDPEQVSYDDLLRAFFVLHDPTTLNRQGPDVGPQYRSVIFHHTPEQRERAEAVIREMEEEGVWDRPIVTELAPFEKFWPAEDYHQQYYRTNPDQPYCRAVVGPKVAKFRKAFAARLKPAAQASG